VPALQRRRLTARLHNDEDDFDDWQAAILCEMCRQPIDPERLEAIPGTNAAPRARKSRSRGPHRRADYCPHCGALVDSRQPRQRHYALQTDLHKLCAVLILSVIPANAGIQSVMALLDCRLRAMTVNTTRQTTLRQCLIPKRGMLLDELLHQLKHSLSPRSQYDPRERV